MNKVDSIKKAIKYVTISVAAVTSLIIVLFVIHIINVQNYNAEWRKTAPNTSTTQVLVDIHPRGGVTDSWVKVDTGLGTDLNAKIYEITVNNNAQIEVNEWYLRINIKEKCYLNNGWCGTFEVHQFDDDGKEIIQTVDLRNFEYDDLTLNYHQIGQDLLIPLNKGDYLIYHPDASVDSGEMPIKGSAEYSGTCSCGVIMYSVTGNIDFSEYELSYRLNMSVWDGTKGKIFIMLFLLLLLSFLIIGTVFLVSVHFEGKLLVKSKTLDDCFRLCCSIADSRDFYSKGHSERVAEYSRMIAEKMGMDRSDCELVYNAALFHNIGNAFVGEQILQKNGKLTKAEYAEVKAHTSKGAELLKDLENIPLAAEAAFFHHERFDGTGYPRGKKEDEIPLIARIVSVADAYDAMNNDRPYRNKLTRERIREELINNRGTQFDPAVVTAFLDIMGERIL